MSETPEISTRENTPVSGEANGMMGSPKQENIPKFNKLKAEQVIQNSNSWIVLGTDRPVGAGSGKTISGDSRASAIDICVGRLGGKPNRDEYVENNFLNLKYSKKAGDAARIYISQRANIDEYFGLSAGTQGMSTDKSAIALSADDIRMVARRGIKLVTAGPKQQDATKFDTNSLFGVELIAGNLDFVDREGNSYLQPMVKGDNLKKFLLEFLSEFDDFLQIFNNFVTYQEQINRTLAAAPAFYLTPAGVPAPTDTTVRLQLVNSQFPKLHAEVIVPLQQQATDDVNRLAINYLLEEGSSPLDICSRYNRVN